jgi:hypothetical protein
MQIDVQHSNHRQNAKGKVADTNVQASQNPAEAALASIRNALASIPEKISLPSFGNSERRGSNTSNEVFYEVKS